jgi:RNA polymerase sigma factor (sigma-70 family)
VPDAAAFEAFYRENLNRIVRACALVTLDVGRAEDVAADAFVRLWSKWDHIESEDHAGGFVFKTAMRLCARDRLLHGRSVAARPGRLEDGDESGRAVLRLEVARALAGVPLRQRQAVVLRDWAGFETKEVSAMLGMRESTVRVHLARGRARLRQAMGADLETTGGAE